MAARLMAFCRALTILFVFSAAFAQDETKKYPEKFVSAYYSTEVQISYPDQATSSYAKEYYDSLDKRGALKIYFQGNEQIIYYDETGDTIIEITEGNCTVTFTNTSPYGLGPINYGWLNKKPLIVGPSALLWYGKDNKDKAVYKGVETVRDIECDKFELKVKNKDDDLTMEYFFAPADWTTPYQYQDLAVPIRVRVSGNSSKYAAFDRMVEVHEINDFAYFRPDIGDFKNLDPPTGIGCDPMTPVDKEDMPKIPSVFQYSAEVVDLMQVELHEDVEIQFQRTWFDYGSLLARRDKFSRKKGFEQMLYDFNTGAMYNITYPGSCVMQNLKNSEFVKDDRMMYANEALNLDGDFYSMGKANIRGIPCDVYESVEENGHYQGKLYSKLVVTVYFTKININVAVNSEVESRIPVFYTITGYNNGLKALQLQYNIYEFTDTIGPPMYDSYRLDRCYNKSESKAYFVVVMDVGANEAAKMEEQNSLIMLELRERLALHAKIPEMRIPYLKADYKPTGVYVTGVMLDRPPAMLQFYKGFSGDAISHDKHLKVKLAATVHDCATACIDESGDPCKGFYFCEKACYVTFNDPWEKGDENRRELGQCTQYIRTVVDSTNFHNAYLSDALGNLENAILNETIEIAFEIPNGVEKITVENIVIGDGPYTGVDGGGKSFDINVEYRKLDKSAESTKVMEYADSLHDCYKRCKEAGSLCSSFSYCPDTPEVNKECMISSQLIVKGDTKDTELVPDKYCYIYNQRYSDLFVAYPEKVSKLRGDSIITGVTSLEKCAENCSREKGFTCRGFEYCRHEKSCTLHKEHILQLKSEDTGKPVAGQSCIHYAARYIADYMDMGRTLIADKTNVREELSLEECAQYCSEDLGDKCKSFNYCPAVDFSQSSCAVSVKLLRDDGISTTLQKGCRHYEKRAEVHDWDDNKKAAKELSKTGYTTKGFTGLVIGMIVLGLIAGAGAFVLYSYFRSRNSGEGMAVRFMKNES